MEMGFIPNSEHAILICEKKRLNLSSFFIIKGLKIVLSRKSLRTTGVNNFYWKMTNYFPASMMISDDCYNTIFKSKFYLVCLRK